MGTGELLGEPNKLHCTGIRNTPSCFMLQKPGLALAGMSQSAQRVHFFKKTDNKQGD